MIQLPTTAPPDAEREQKRWIRTLAIPFIAASALIAAALGGSGAWLVGFALLCGPGLGLAALLYLTFTSDANGDAATGERRHRIVVVGGGFAGLQAVRGLRHAPVEVTLVDRQNFTLFQPLVYQVATGALAPAEIAKPLRAIFRRQRNVRILLAEVTGFDLERREVVVDQLPTTKGEESDPERRRSWLTFVVVGAGPTGVEMAGQIAELAHDAVRRDFRSADTQTARVLLVEAAERVLPAFPESLSRKAARALEQLGVTPLAGRTVVDIGPTSVAIQTPKGELEHVPTRTAVWAAGVTASGLAAKLSDEAGLEVDRAGRLTVQPDLTLPGHPEVLALGDMVQVQSPDGTITLLPGLAPVAMQEGRYAARAIRKRLQNRPPRPFHYRDKGNLATIGRSKAVADIKGLHLAGFPAWALWLTVHLFYLVGFENRLLVVLRWTISFLTRGRGARLMIGRADLDRADPATSSEERLAA
jgi:NADH:quinone reductase (non-electrogenic)